MDEIGCACCFMGREGGEEGKKGAFTKGVGG